MAHMTLLDMVQTILSSMDSDEVNSISDTVESMQVADVIKNTYFYLMDTRDRPYSAKLTKLESALASNPVKMRLPEDVIKVLWIKYNTIAKDETAMNYTPIKYKEPDDFIDEMFRRNQDLTEVEVYTDPDYDTPFLVLNDTAPSFWTSFDDQYIIFDSYDKLVDSTLQNSKSLIHGLVDWPWTNSDTFVPHIPEKLQQLLLNEAKAAAMIEIKQVADPVSEKRKRKLTTRMQHAQWRTNGRNTGPHYGRK